MSSRKRDPAGGNRLRLRQWTMRTSRWEKLPTVDLHCPAPRLASHPLLFLPSLLLGLRGIVTLIRQKPCSRR